VEKKLPQFLVAAARAGAMWGSLMFVFMGIVMVTQGLISDLPRFAVVCAVGGAAFGLWMVGLTTLGQLMKQRRLRRRVQDPMGSNKAA
jgi:membrane associated rhomboid family serine protease